MPGGVVRFAFPRIDLKVAVGDVQVLPALALTGWVAFLPTNDGTVVMGDVVLTLMEVAPVTNLLQKGGVEITATHDHLLGEVPRVTFVHIFARGDAMAIAKTVHDALALSGTPLTLTSAPSNGLAYPLDTAAIRRALGAGGKVNGGVYQTSVPGPAPVTLRGVTLPAAMGISDAINFQPVDSVFAIAAGDFVVAAGHEQAVVQALTSHGFTMTAVHAHFSESTPSLLFAHFWGNDSPQRLLEGLKQALAASR
jgi:hypothetical protein